jgi:hypothetical protein
VVVYLISHYSVAALERRLGRALGAWRTVIFFGVFLLLIIIAMRLLPLLLGGEGGP